MILQPTFLIADALARGELEPLLPEFPTRPCAIFANRNHMPFKVRSFIDHLVDFLGDPPPWDRQHPNQTRTPT